MKGYKVVVDHIPIGGANGQADQISLNDGYIIGISIENLNASTDNLKYGINENPKILVEPGDPARSYGGFECCGVPCYYVGYLKWAFETDTAPSGLVILTRIVPEEKEIE